MNPETPPTIITIQNTSAQKRKFEVKYQDAIETVDKNGLAVKVKDAIEGFSRYIRINSSCIENVTQVIATVLKEDNTQEYDEIDFLAHLDIHQQQGTVIDVQKSLRLNSNLALIGSIEPNTTIQIAIFHSSEISEQDYLTLGVRIQNLGKRKLPYHLFDLDGSHKNIYPEISIYSRSSLIDYEALCEILKEIGNVKGIIFNTNNPKNASNEIEIRTFIKNSMPLKVHYSKIIPHSCIEEYQSIESIINIPFIQDLRTPRNTQFLLSGDIEPESKINLIFMIKNDSLSHKEFLRERAPRLTPDNSKILSNENL